MRIIKHAQFYGQYTLKLTYLVVVLLVQCPYQHQIRTRKSQNVRLEDQKTMRKPANIRMIAINNNSFEIISQSIFTNYNFCLFKYKIQRRCTTQEIYSKNDVKNTKTFQ